VPAERYVVDAEGFGAMGMFGFRGLAMGLAAAILGGCGAQNGATVPQGVTAQSRAHEASGSYGYCPANPSGTGVLPDGDFAQGLNDGDHFTEPHKGVVFAPYWKVSKRNIDFNGTTFWEMDGYCSVDLDGNVAGGIVTSAFPTKRFASYTVTFLLSGNGGQGKGNPPVVKKMVLQAASQFEEFTWDTSNDNDVEHGKWAAQSWTFKAEHPLTTLRFTSEDPHQSSRGAVVAAIAVTKEP
jgi:uncharacterized protein DUF642